MPIVEPTPIAGDRRALLALDVHGGYAHHLNDIGGFGLALVGLTVAPTPRWSWSALAVPALTSTTLEAPEGRAEVSSTLLGFGTDYAVLPQRIGLSVGLGATLGLVTIRGSAAYPYLGQKDRIITALPFVRSEGVVEMAHDLSLRLGLMAGLATPPAVIRFGGREVAPWGRPLVLLTFGVRAGVPGTER